MPPVLKYVPGIMLASLLIAPLLAFADPDPAGIEAFDGIPVAEIRILGLRNTREYVVRRELRNRTGKNFSYRDWIMERNTFLGLDLFVSVSLDGEKTGEGLILTYRFLELFTFFVYPTGKQTDQDGWFLGPAMTFMNFLGSGTKITALARSTVIPEKFTSTEYLAMASSRWLGPLPVEYALELTKTESYNPLKRFNENSMEAALSLYQRIRGPFRIMYTGGTYYIERDRKNETFTGRDRNYDMFLSQHGYDVVPRLGAGVVCDTRDRVLNPHRGVYNEIGLTQNGGNLGGQSNYREILFDFRGYANAGTRNIFHLSILGQYRPGTMGFYDYYNVGGANSIRTYEPDPMMYGKHELIATAEYRFEFLNRLPLTILDINLYMGLQAVAGCDYAVLWDRRPSPGDGRSYTGYYAGIHVLVPGVDRFRIEYGFHRNGRKPRGIELGLTLGIREKSVTQRNRVR